jgi:hypothetical protein
MKIDINNLPSGDAILHQIITDLVSEVLSLTNKNISLEDQLTHLQEQLALLKKQRFGQSSEKLDIKCHICNKIYQQTFLRIT